MTISDSATGMSKGVWVSSAWVAMRKTVNPTICVMMNGLPIQSIPNPHNEEYLRTKRERLGHTLHHQGLPLDEELIHSEQQGQAEGGAPADDEVEPADG